ncbi:TPA_asm: TonB-dependent receptor plug domain-containing protein [Salmonella enterica subsp. enterica serovar Java]|nr:TonB-dependent receptor plug domain-containing protein [Salmonella enterica]HAE9668565.1 TonB-dependent receptor plug domain-containing protein [Salmonella enterica subsp. enterica serovar Java]
MATENSDREESMVVTASGYEQKITDAAASVSVISRQELERKNYTDLGQALRGIEGVDVQSSTGKTGGLDISIRGMSSNYTLILIDGIRQNVSGDVTPNGFGTMNTSFMPPLSAIDHIEVIRGPMSTLYGSDAIGGVVNIITRKTPSHWSTSVSASQNMQEHNKGEYVNIFLI